MKASNDPFFQAVQNAAATRAHRLAARLGLSAEDRQDVQQELVVSMLERADQFDPTRGSAGTFTGVVSEHRATELMDRLIKDRMRLVFGFGAPASNESEFQPGPDEQIENVIPMWADDSDLFSDTDDLRDLETALAYMNDEQVELFQLLSAHQDLPSACKASGISTATFYRRVSELQLHLRMFGFRTAA